MKHRILIVDDQPNILKLISYRVEQLGYKTDTASNGLHCLKKLEEHPYSVVLLDIQMPVMDGMSALEKIKELYPNLPVIMVTANDEISQAVNAIKLGAFEYLIKPIDFDRLETEISNAVEIHDLRGQVTDLKQQVQSNNLFTNIIGRSEALQNVFNMANRVLKTDVSILIIGASGSGKELLARGLHEGSHRRGQPFVPVNSAAISRELADSLFFGHRKGSFTGANEDRVGYFEQANGGTLFLDEIGDMDLDLQGKILRVLEEKTVRPVGSKNEKKVDFRVISATNRDLGEFIREGKFRKDLYYRLEEYPIYLPSLAERQSDIPMLASHFLAQFCENNQLDPLSISDEGMKVLQNHGWSGNIRELKNVIHRAALRCTGDIIQEFTFSSIDEPKNKKPTFTATASGPSGGDVIPFEQVEKNTIEHAYNVSDQNALEAARLLGISRATIYRKLKQFEIE